MGGVIDDDQRAALAKLAAVLPSSFYLAGGVGVAAHLAHRRSHDLDLFSREDPTELISVLDALPGVSVSGRAAGTVYLTVDAVPVSLIQYRYELLGPTGSVADLPVPIASVDDLISMKLSAIAGRGAARDFWDLHSLLCHTGRSLRDALDGFARKYPTQDLGHVLRSLVYFGDAEAAPMPAGLERQHWEHIKRDFQAWVPPLVA